MANVVPRKTTAHVTLYALRTGQQLFDGLTAARREMLAPASIPTVRYSSGQSSFPSEDNTYTEDGSRFVKINCMFYKNARKPHLQSMRVCGSRVMGKFLFKALMHATHPFVETSHFLDIQ